jgi:hypothetical protein
MENKFKKLQLNKETIARLDDASMNNVFGGAAQQGNEIGAQDIVDDNAGQSFWCTHASCICTMKWVCKPEPKEDCTCGTCSCCPC